jgi:hypothetical protein
MCELVFDQDLKTYLSPNVYRLLCEEGISGSDVKCLSNCAAENVFVAGFVNWNVLSSEFLSCARTGNDYFCHVRSLAPVFASIRQYYETISENDFEVKFLRFISWNTQQSFIMKSLCILHSRSPTGPDHALLLLTAILERALGDLVMLRATQCPALLRDLLEMKELEDLLSPAVIQLLSIVIGPPKSLNLRNIVWHGFLRPGELNIQYPYVILCIIVSIGKLLMEKGITDIPHRVLLRINIPQVFPAVDVCQSVLDEIKHLFYNSHFVAVALRPYWNTSLELYVRGNYGECVAILLPQLEMALRRIFVAANDCSKRILTAENSVLFTTLDEILAKLLPVGSENQFPKTIGSPCMTLLLDFLTYPMGPRVRDHVSHGEVNFDSMTFDVAHHLVCLCIALASKFVPRNVTYKQPTFVKAICETADKYESLFHPISIVKQHVCAATQSLSLWKAMPRPELHEFDSEAGLVWQETSDTLVSSACGAFQNFSSALLARSETYKSLFAALEPFADMNAIIIANVAAVQLNTVFRYSDNSSSGMGNSATIVREEEILRMLTRILKLAFNISQQVLDTAGERHKQWLSKQMHSRQRANYVRFLNSISTISIAVRLIGLTSLIVVCQLDELKQNSLLQTALIKHFKYVQKYCENLLTYTSSAVNKWSEAVTMSNDLCRRMLAFKAPMVS